MAKTRSPCSAFPMEIAPFALRLSVSFAGCSMDPATTLDADSRELPQGPRRRRWGPWATLGWGIPLAATAVISQTLGAIGFMMWWRIVHPDQSITRADIATNGPLLAFSLAVSMPLVLGLLALVVRLSGVPLRQYLALEWA